MQEYIGLFGTCGSSKWRQPFIKKYNELGIDFFNPQLGEGKWHPGCIAIENTHLNKDGIILFPVTHETTGQGSLAEIGFSIQAALTRNPDRYFIFMIDEECKDTKASRAQIEESNRSRALVLSKLTELSKSNDGIFVVDNLDDMLSLSIELHSIIVSFNIIKKYAIHD